jgi:methionyl-tRNA formyltransferase
MIYLFTNRVFGEPFIRTAAELARERSLPIVLVLSNLRRQGPAAARSPWARLRRRAGLLRRRIRLQRELGLPVRIAERVNDESFRRRIDSGAHGVIAGFDQILAPSLIERFASIVNFHASLLPFYRGPVPAYWCLRNGERTTGFSLHRVIQKIDAGEVLWQETVPIEAGDEPEALTRRIGERAQETFRRYLVALDEGRAFDTRLLDAAAAYRVHVGYASFPDDRAVAHRRSGAESPKAG